MSLRPNSDMMKRPLIFFPHRRAIRGLRLFLLLIVFIQFIQKTDQLVWKLHFFDVDWDEIRDPGKSRNSAAIHTGKQPYQKRIHSKTQVHIPEDPIDVNDPDSWRTDLGLYSGQIEILIERTMERDWWTSEEEIRALTFIDAYWFDRHCHLFLCMHPSEREIDINRFDSLEWRKLPGIGDWIGKQIVEHRERLGGFNDPTQLTEVYGISDSLFLSWPYIWKVDSNLIDPIQYPANSFAELLAHPYLDYQQVEELYRFHDNMQFWLPCSEWILLNSFDEEDIRKLKPYFPDE